MQVRGILEPTVIASIISPAQYQGTVMGLCSDRRGDLLEQAVAGEGRILLRYTLPLSELATDFYSEIKARTQG
jgi:GTP-binding protein LepA